MRTILKYGFWLLLALPAIFMVKDWLGGTAEPERLLHPSGEFAVRAMVLAMLIGPLVDIFGPNTFFRLWMKARRWLGVAAAGYSLLHLVLYVAEMGNLADIWAEVTAPAIWTGWIAFFIMLAAGIISNDAAMRQLKIWWKRTQMLLYPAAFLTLLHWGLIENHWMAAFVHFTPLALVWAMRLIIKPQRKKKRTQTAA